MKGYCVATPCTQCTHDRYTISVVTCLGLYIQKKIKYALIKCVNKNLLKHNLNRFLLAFYFIRMKVLKLK